MPSLPASAAGVAGVVRDARAGATLRTVALPGLAAVDPLDVAEAFRETGGLALLETTRPGGRWTFLVADPVETVDPSPGDDPFAAARRALARLADGGPGWADGPSPIGPTFVRSAGEPGLDPSAGEPGLDASAWAPLDPSVGKPLDPSAGALPFAGGLVGFLGYDLKRRFERLPAIARADIAMPDLRLALHDWVLAWDRRHGRAWLAGRALDRDVARLDERLAGVMARLGARLDPGGGRLDPSAIAPGAAAVAARHPVPSAGRRLRTLAFESGLTRAAWIDRVEAIRSAIAAGELYQANLARRLEAPFDADPWLLHRALRGGDPARFGAYLDLGEGRAIVSASPEPFLAISPAGVVTTDPIKGTRPRGADRATERLLARALLASPKDRAENVMIVDVLRNDLGRVCRPGSVRVPRLCRLERTPTVQHLVSTVTGTLAPGRDPFDLLAAAFPGGSITGAPKIRAMELIDALEPVRRGPYTGALGWIGPDGAMATSILIRTLVADGERVTLHVGGGITWRSDAAAEWEETAAKAAGPLGALGAREVTR